MAPKHYPSLLSIPLRWVIFPFFPALLILVPVILFFTGPIDIGRSLDLSISSSGIRLEAGQKATIPVPNQFSPTGRYRLTLNFRQGHFPQAGLSLLSREGSSIRPVKSSEGELEFISDSMISTGHLVTFVNTGQSGLVVTKANLRNYVANNTGLPRLMVMLDRKISSYYPLSGQILIFLSTLALLAMGSYWSCRKGAPRQTGGWSWLVILGPLLCLLVGGAMKFWGLSLVLSYDAVILLCGAGGWIQVLVKLPKFIQTILKEPPAAKLSFDWLAFMFPGIVIFIYIPFALFMPQSEEFDSDLFVMSYLLYAFTVWALLSSTIFFLKDNIRGKLVEFLFLLGVFFLAKDSVAPVSMALLDGHDIGRRIETPLPHILAELIVFTCLVFLLIKVKWDRIRKYAGIFIIISLIIHVCTVEFNFSDQFHYKSVGSASNYGKSALPPLASTSGNIYHIILDTFSGHIIERLLKHPETRQHFSGCICFPNNRSNLLHTHQSVPSFMTGSYPPFANPGEEFESWAKRVGSWRYSCKTKGLLLEAYARGYTVTQYLPALRWFPHHKASNIYSALDIRDSNMSRALFSDLWLLRVAPLLFKNLIFKNEQGLFSEWLTPPGSSKSVYWSEDQMNRVISHETYRPNNGQYVYIHLAVPHPPIILDEQCKYVPYEGTEYNEDSYVAQANCALCLVNRLLAELKKLGRFKSSTIIIHADHGMFWPKERRHEVDSKYLMPEDLYQGINHRESCDIGSLALLLIKPPGCGEEPLRCDFRSVSLVDLAQTVYDLKGWKIKTPDGKSLFDHTNKTNRRIDIFIGLHPLLKEGIRHVILENGRWCVNHNYPRAPS